MATGRVGPEDLDPATLDGLVELFREHRATTREPPPLDAARGRGPRARRRGPRRARAGPLRAPEGRHAPRRTPSSPTSRATRSAPSRSAAADDVRARARGLGARSASRATGRHGARGATTTRSLRDPMARVVGAREDEVVVMNSLDRQPAPAARAPSTDRPPARHRIVIEDAAFPSDSYAVRSHVAFRGYDPDDGVVRLRPRDGERLLRTEDVVAHLERDADRARRARAARRRQLPDRPAASSWRAITAAARDLGVTSAGTSPTPRATHGSRCTTGVRTSRRGAPTST